MPPSAPLSLTFDWTDLTGPELAELAGRDPVVVFPLAAIEQHGPHLPVSPDLVVARGIFWHCLLGRHFVARHQRSRGLGGHSCFGCPLLDLW